MSRLSPQSSCSSINSLATVVSSSTRAGPGDSVPRKRVTPEQATALKKLFNAKSHPSREERVALASEIGMELKAVTIWFQNRRQSTKRQQRSGKENMIPEVECNAGRQHSSFPADTSTSRPSRKRISLDHFAERCQRPFVYPSTPAHPIPPLTLRTTNVPSTPTAGAHKSDIWKRMLSSPTAPPSPTKEISRFSLPSRSQSTRSLEWACAKARIALKRDEPDRLPQVAEEGNDMDTDTTEIVTPHINVASLPIIKSTDRVGEGDGEEVTNIKAYSSEAVEAAMGLLGLMAQR